MNQSFCKQISAHYCHGALARTLVLVLVALSEGSSCLQPEGSGVAELDEESALLQQFVEVVRTFTNGRAASNGNGSKDASGTSMPSILLDETEITRHLRTFVGQKAKDGAPVFVIVVVTVVFVLVLFFFVMVGPAHFLESSSPIMSATGPGAGLKGAKGQSDTFPGLRNIDAGTFRPPNSKTPPVGSGRTTPTIMSPPKSPSPPAPATLAMVVSRKRHVLQVPSLLDSPQEQFRKADYTVRDSAGTQLLHVDVMRPPLQDVEEQEAGVFLPVEYVSLYTCDTHEELAMCALGPNHCGEWECHLYRSETELFGYIVEEHGAFGALHGEAQFALLSYPGAERMLWVKGKLEERRLQVFDAGREVAALVEPSAAGREKPGACYTVTCMAQADEGLVVLLLLGLDRLRSHRAPGG